MVVVTRCKRITSIGWSKKPTVLVAMCAEREICCGCLSPNAGAVGTLAEELGEGRGEVTLNAATVHVLEEALSVAQVARGGEHPA